MKYTILGFQQEKLLNLKLTTDHALVMRTIKDMYSSAGMEFRIINGDSYMWVNQNYFHKQIPIVGSKRTLANRIKELTDLGLFERKLLHERNGKKGNFSYIKPTVKLDELQDYTPHAKSAQGSCKNNMRVMQDVHDKDTSIKDTSIKDTNTNGGGNPPTEEVKRVQLVRDMFSNNGFGNLNITTDDMLRDLIEDYTSSWVIDAMEIAIKSNVRRINYVEGILKRWTVEGKDDGLNSGDELSSKKSQWKDEVRSRPGFDGYVSDLGERRE